MSRTAVHAVFLFISALFSITLVAQNEPQTKNIPELPIEYFTKTSENRSAIISPDGKHAIIITKKDGKDVFGIIRTKDQKPISLIGVSGSKNHVDKVHWVNNERLVYTIYETKKYDKRYFGTGELFGVNLDGSKHKIIFGHRARQGKGFSKHKKAETSYATHKIISYLKNDKKSILIAYYPFKLIGDYWRYDYYAKPYIKKLDIYSGKMTDLGSLPISGSRALVDNNSDVRFAIGIDEENNRVISYRETPQSKWVNYSIENFEGVDAVPLSFAKDNQSVYLTANVGSGTRALYLFDLKNQSFKKLFHDKNVDIGRRGYDYINKRIIYVATELGVPKYHYLEPKHKAAKLHRALLRSFPNQDIKITSATESYDKAIVLVYADNNPGDLYLVGTNPLRADYLMSLSKWIEPSYLVKTKPVNFTTRDGQIIHGYLTKPRGAGSEKPPFVVYPHGGPHGIRDEWYYQWRVQLLANRGYAVLQVNYRGSGGFGKEFEEIGYGKWGTLMQDDITDATRALVNQNIADPERICIYGGSYGGYAALMGVIREPNLYKCAIGSAGVYDLPLMFEEGDIPNRLKAGLAYLREAVGEDVADLKSRSPVYNVNKIKANILLIHGNKDERVPISQAEALKVALDGIEKPYSWLELSGEGHYTFDERNRTLSFEKILAFLDKNIGEQSLKNIAQD